MPYETSTKDCTQLTDTELAEMADLCAEAPSRYEAGQLSKQAEEWVLVTTVREGNLLRGFSFATLERIGGTPAILLGLAHVKRSAKRDQILKALIADNYRRALMAFPDEDVLVGTRMVTPGAFEAFKALVDINPRPDHKSSGEERAWGRRLAKRFSVDAGYNDRTFHVRGDGGYPLVVDHETLKPEKVDPDVAAFYEVLDTNRGDCLITFGWMMAEELLKYNG